MTSNHTPATVSRRLRIFERHLNPSNCSSSSSSVTVASTSSGSSSLTRAQIRIAPEVNEAIKAGKPVVALESTIISHGMPYPQNVDCALQVEAACRVGGATPATIAILNGIIHVGLDRDALEMLGKAGEKCAKVSRRDLAHVIASKAHGATTVSGTMFIASLVGIHVFVTGGIGGVHRGVESTMDISADLNELGRTPVAVVCAGVKSILDIGRTLEYLETQGVPVMAYGTNEFPAFFTRHSGMTAPIRVDSSNEVASLIHTGLSLGMTNGYVVGVPIPECDQAAAEPVEAATQRALKEADAKGVKGRDITPFLLGRINELTQGASLKSNIALILNNVKIGSKIAVDLANVRKILSSSSVSSESCLTSASFSSSSSVPSPLVIGGTNQDLLGRPTPGSKFLLGTSNPGSLTRCWGGVGRNVAEVLGRLETKPVLLTAVGADEPGDQLKRHCQTVGIQTHFIQTSQQHSTSTYMAILDEKGDLFTTIADMDVCSILNPSHLPSNLSDFSLIITDGNISQSLIDATCARAVRANVPVFFEPTSIEKCVRIVPALLRNEVTYLSPSAAELLAIEEEVNKLLGEGSAIVSTARDAYENNHATDAVEKQCQRILASIATRATNERRTLRPVHIVLKRGERGVLIASLLPSSSSPSSSSYRIELRHLPIYPLSHVVNTSGAGDTLVGATCWSLIHESLSSRSIVQGHDLDAVVRAASFGMRAAELTLGSESSVAPTITPQSLKVRQQAFLQSEAGAGMRSKLAAQP